MSRVRVALFGTMSRTLIAFLAIVHAVRSEQCSAWVEVDTITGSRGAGCSEPPDESYEGSVVGGVDVASAQRICNNACWLGHANSASGLSGSTWSELYPVPHTVIGGIVRNHYCYCWHATCTRTRTTKLKDNGNPTVFEHQTVPCPPARPPRPPPSPSPLPPGAATLHVGGGWDTDEVSWTLSCSDGTSMAGGAPYVSTQTITNGAACTLSMYDSDSDGWNYNSWVGFAQWFTLGPSMSARTVTFTAGTATLPPPAAPPAPPSSPEWCSQFSSTRDYCNQYSSMLSQFGLLLYSLQNMLLYSLQ